MPTGHKIKPNMTNFEAICYGLGIERWDIHFIIPEDKIDGLSVENYYEKRFKAAFFCGSRESCERNLHSYPNCKIV